MHVYDPLQSTVMLHVDIFHLIYEFMRSADCHTFYRYCVEGVLQSADRVNPDDNISWWIKLIYGHIVAQVAEGGVECWEPAPVTE